jgi:hypothetical protein
MKKLSYWIVRIRGKNIFLSQWPVLCLDKLIFEVYRSQKNRRTPDRTHLKGDQLVGEAANYTRHNKRGTRSFMPSAGSELTIPAIERPQKFVLYRPAAGIGTKMLYVC